MCGTCMIVMHDRVCTYEAESPELELAGYALDSKC